MIDEGGAFDRDGGGAIDRSFQPDPVVLTHLDHFYRDPGREDSSDYR